MASRLTFTTYNMFGFNQGYPLLRSICDSADIVMLQEHWLPPFDLHALDNVNSDFTAFASSAMSQAVKSDILKGRPYGGVAFLIRNNIARKVKCICKCERYIILRLENLILVNVYMPCKSASNYADQFAEILACILNYVADFSGCDVIMGGDFNCEFRSSEHSTWPLLCEFMRECDLSCTDHLIADDRCYTYFQPTTGATSHIDHFVISKNLLSCVQVVSVDDNGSNLSDHLPVTLMCELSLDSVNAVDAVSRSYLPESKNCYQLRWDKADLISYYNRSYDLLAGIDVRYLHRGQIGIEYCYKSIVHSLHVAATETVPQKKSIFINSGGTQS